MSVFEFLKTAGRKVIDELSAGQAQAATPSAQPSSAQTSSSPTVTSDALSDKLTQYVQKLGLDLQNASVRLNGDKATIEGAASDQQTLEKAILAIGNVMGVGQVESKMTAPGNAAESKFYTVKSGDTLSKIAVEQYGHANAYMKIFEANKPLLKNPDDIFPGQKLRIPQDGSATQAA